MKNILNIVGGFAALAFLVECGRQTDYLFIARDGKRPIIDQKIKLKEINSTNKVDVLWVIDNSGSMSTHQANVIGNTDAFMKAFTSRKHLDWKMGLLSTDKIDQPYIGFTPSTALNFRTPDPVTRFQEAVRRLGLDRGCPEVVYEPILRLLPKYPGFLRKDAALAIIALTDTMEDSASDVAAFDTFIKSVKRNIQQVRFYGTFAGASFSCTSGEPHWLYPGSHFERNIKLTKGRVFSLCDSDFGKNLAKVGEEIATLVTRSSIRLKERPRPSTLEVAYKGKLLPPGTEEKGGFWSYDFEANAVVFHSLDFTDDDEEAAVSIQYETSKPSDT